MQKGQINVQTENIFPIIKKFLYSDQEIFLRELISNAVDATQKLKSLSSLGNFKGEMGNIDIEVILDTKKKTLTVKDKGIGMTAEEVEKYINQIAFSGATEFLEKYKGKSEQDVNAIIGHFGLGFYSSFMVADKVEIKTKTYKKGAGSKAVRWECEGNPDYSLEEIDKKDRGTEVILHINEDSKEFLEESRIHSLLKKYCKFLPVPIIFGEETVQKKIEGEKDKDGNDKYESVKQKRVVNNTNPLWKKTPADIKEEEYLDFYRELYPSNFSNPLFNIHLNVDYPFNLTGILYFPKLKKNFEVQRDKIQLYSNQVFITDSVENIVPDFLTLLHGVIDSPDIPINVSRSYLQSDSSVKKISTHITKKVADKLEELFKEDRKSFEEKWDDIRVFIEYGMLSEDKFYERALEFCLLKNTEKEYFTFKEYEEKIKENQTDKDKKLVYLYTSDLEKQDAYIAKAREKGYDVLLMDGPVDNHFINMLEGKLENTSFVRVDADTVDKLIKKEDDRQSKLSEDEQKKLKEYIEEIKGEQHFDIVLENMDENEQPMLITRPEFMRRMKDMSAMGGMEYMQDMQDSLNLVVNTNHPIMTDILNIKDDNTRKTKLKQLKDIALLSQNLLKGKDLTEFINRSVEVIK
jgi:molecular chaperone HtpG